VLRVGFALAVLGIGALGILPKYWPVELPPLAQQSRIYARPHRVVEGQNIESSGLVERLRRLGYRELEPDGSPEPGQFARPRGRLILHRRAFRSPAASGEARIAMLQLGKGGRIEKILDESGKSLASVVLEPEVVGEIHSEIREARDAIPLSEMPDHLVKAVLTIEDRRFFEHSGLDLWRVAGAMFANLRAGRLSQGGSTLTQQLVKNVYLDDARTLRRKIPEAWLALRVEQGQGKDAILETYLNTIYLGQRDSVSIRGVEEASKHYFGKSARNLRLDQSALLAGLIRGPGLYSPYLNPERALARRNTVLSILLGQDQITPEEYVIAVSRPLDTLPEPPRPVRAPFFSAWVEREVRKMLPETDLSRAGLAVLTGLDSSLQAVAEDAVAKGLRELEARHKRLKRPDEAPLQACLIALDPKNGDVLALVGGRDYSRKQYDHVTQAARQTGSVFKPIAVLSGLARGPDGLPAVTLASQFEDEPLTVQTRAGLWQPTNYDGSYSGLQSVRRSLERSLNVPIARLALEVGPDHIVETARRLGIQSRLQPVPSIALGAFELTPLEVARAYGVFAGGGVRVRERPYEKVLDSDGVLLTEQPVESERVFDAAETLLVTAALVGAIDRGTGVGLRARGFRGPVAGKTGSTNDLRDSWFVAYTPELVVVVWVGFDDATSTGLPGAEGALPIAADFLIRGIGAQGGSDFPTPSGIEIVEVNPETGLRAGFGCPGEQEVFLIGTAPEGKCRRVVQTYPDDPLYGGDGDGDRRRDRRSRDRDRGSGRQPPDTESDRERRRGRRSTDTAFERFLDDLLDAIGVGR
jgi:penicillin-binding protein 1B